MISFYSKKRIIPFSLLAALLLICITVTAVGANQKMATVASCISVYEESDNSVTRRQALNTLEDVVTRRGINTPKVVRDLLVNALNDKSPVVVSVAVYQIGNFGIPGLDTKLINLYDEVEKKYSASYARRIQYAIVPALGKTGGAEASVFLSRLLAEDNGTAMGEFLLLAINELHEPALIDVVSQYKVKMQGMVQYAKSQNVDPLIYSRRERYANLAAGIEKALGSKGGK